MSTKKNVLALLESERGISLSGENIAQRLGVTRAAVWKAVKELQKQGYSIKAVTNRGYVLGEENDILSAEGIRPFLVSQYAAEVVVHDVVESTNTIAKEMAVAGAAHGTVVIAKEQTAGRGRYNRVFASPAGSGIYMSFILRPAEWLMKNILLATHHAAVCVCEAIEAVTTKQPKIKWVNDVFLAGRKVCGISTEAMTDFESGQIAWIVVGIGINHTQPMCLPPEFREIVGAVFSDGEPLVTKNKLAAEVINRVVFPLYDVESELIAEYRKRMLAIGQVVEVKDENPYNALVIDVEEAGRLVVRRESGEVEVLQAGEISINVNLN